jgi:hypothetical protein
MANGVILWEGPSEIDGKPIVVIATGIKGRSSRNGKTGDLIQTWILRQDIAPHEAVHTGDDESICGKCPHRGEIVDGKNVSRSCYVTVFQAPLSVWKTYRAGKYPLAADLGKLHLAQRNVRLGAYGDPAAVPLWVWECALVHADKGTGYTHQWMNCDPGFAKYCMASADSACEALAAQAMGYRTFRVGTFAEKHARGEFLCPASEEAGKKVNCAQCLACGGTSSPNKASVFIPAHGSKAKVKAFAERVAA